MREERLAEAVERAGKAILQPECVPAVYRLAAGAERENATHVKSAGCVSQKLVAGAGFEPVGAKSANATPTPHTSANPLQDNALAPSPTDGDSHISTNNIQRSNESQQPKCVPESACGSK